MNSQVPKNAFMGASHEILYLCSQHYLRLRPLLTAGPDWWCPAIWRAISFPDYKCALLCFCVTPSRSWHQHWAITLFCTVVVLLSEIISWCLKRNEKIFIKDFYYDLIFCEISSVHRGQQLSQYPIMHKMSSLGFIWKPDKESHTKFMPNYLLTK